MTSGGSMTAKPAMPYAFRAMLMARNLEGVTPPIARNRSGSKLIPVKYTAIELDKPIGYDEGGTAIYTELEDEDADIDALSTRRTHGLTSSMIS